MEEREKVEQALAQLARSGKAFSDKFLQQQHEAFHRIGVALAPFGCSLAEAAKVLQGTRDSDRVEHER